MKTEVRTFIEPDRLARPDEIPGPLKEMAKTLDAMRKRQGKSDDDDGDPLHVHVRVRVHRPAKSRKESAGDELDRRARKYMAANKTSYFDALCAVSKNDRQLAATYAAVDREAHRRD